MVYTYSNDVEFEGNTHMLLRKLCKHLTQALPHFPFEASFFVRVPNLEFSQLSLRNFFCMEIVAFGCIYMREQQTPTQHLIYSTTNQALTRLRIKSRSQLFITKFPHFWGVENLNKKQSASSQHLTHLERHLVQAALGDTKILMLGFSRELTLGVNKIR